MEENVVLGGMAAIPIIVAIVAGLKPFIPSRSVPFVSMIIGVIWNVGLTLGTDEFSREDVFLGMVIGLAASGLYSAGTSVVGEIQDRREDKEGATESYRGADVEPPPEDFEPPTDPPSL